MSLVAFIEIIRPINCLIAVFGVLVGFFLSVQGIQLPPELYFALLAVFFVCAGGQAVNDYFDFETDKKAGKSKPLVKGKMTRKQALIYSIILFLIGILFSTQINFIAVITALFFSLLLISYSALMKKIKYLGNFVVSFSVAFTILYGAIISMNFFLPFILFASAFFANTSREIIKDLEDLKTEQGIKITLPQLLPKKAVYSLVIFFYLLSVAVGFYPFFIGKFNSLIYLLLMFIAVVFFALSSHAMVKGNYVCGQQRSKIGMFCGLIAFLFGVISI
jgi:geranylgeranylglycerol-phosphate geranylgeranyltransferase